MFAVSLIRSMSGTRKAVLASFAMVALIAAISPNHALGATNPPLPCVVLTAMGTPCPSPQSANPAGYSSLSCLDKSSGNIRADIATPLLVWAAPDTFSPNRTKVGLTLYAMNCSDVGGEDASITITTCTEGQQSPFSIERTRHLSGPSGYGESLKAIDGGRIIVWNAGLTPSFQDGPRSLHVVFNLPTNKGGPTFCVTAAGFTPAGTRSTPVIQVRWDLTTMK
ncbi:MAG: hypothetical protein Q7R60_02830 [bacterium]|nr:hypothetical protein [bacterium]